MQERLVQTDDEPLAHRRIVCYNLIVAFTEQKFGMKWYNVGIFLSGICLKQ
jgi:hypothetical protein